MPATGHDRRACRRTAAARRPGCGSARSRRVALAQRPCHRSSRSTGAAGVGPADDGQRQLADRSPCPVRSTVGLRERPGRRLDLGSACGRGELGVGTPARGRTRRPRARRSAARTPGRTAPDAALSRPSATTIVAGGQRPPRARSRSSGACAGAPPPAPPATPRSSGLAPGCCSPATRPSTNSTSRLAQRVASRSSWVTSSSVWPIWLRSSSRSITCSPARLSSAPVGSSASSSAGRFISARATATRCRSPPLSCGRVDVARARRCPARRAAPARGARAGAAGVPVSWAASATLSSAGRSSSRLKNWKIMPMRRRRNRASPVSFSSPRFSPCTTTDAGGRPVQAGDHVEQGRLAAAGRAHHRHRLAGADLQRHPVQGGRVAVLLAYARRGVPPIVCRSWP